MKILGLFLVSLALLAVGVVGLFADYFYCPVIPKDSMAPFPFVIGGVIAVAVSALGCFSTLAVVCSVMDELGK